MRLSDSFMKLIAYMNYFLKNHKGRPTPYETVRPQIERLLEESEKDAETNGFSRTDYDLARFAILAWMDEAVLSSDWKEKTKWMKEPMQQVYYHVTNAGESFFEKLNTIGPHQRDVREIYYLCLSMGFSGQYVKEGDEFMLEQLKMSNLKFLTGAQAGLQNLANSEIFPEAYLTDETFSVLKGVKKNQRSSLSTLIGIVSPVVLYIVLFVIFRFVLGNIGENLIHTVPK